MNLCGKKAQITVFIIIGIVLLASAGAYFVIRNIMLEKELILEEPVLKKLPEEIMPVRDYVDTCIRSVAIEGLTALGEHGGYISLQDAENNVNFRISETEPTESDAVPFITGSSLVIPYWSYLTSPNKNFHICEYSSKRPPLRKGSSTGFVPQSAAIEAQLERYMNNNLKQCISNFFSLERRGFEIKDGDVSSEVTVAEEDIRFIVKYPLSVSAAGTETSVDLFYVKIPLELKKIYELGSALSGWQANSSFIERHALGLISIYSGLESDDLPPDGQAGFEFGGGKMWAKTKVKQDVISMLSSWIRGMQVFGTANFRFIAADEDSPYADSLNRIYDNMIISLFGYDNFIVNFDYLGWPIYFDVANSEGEMIKAESISNNLLSVVGYQEYNTLYDISFPVYVEIKTLPTIEFPQGYRFLLFLEANIRSSDPFKCGTPLIETPPLTSGTLLCNENQRLSGDVNINVIDWYTEEPIPGVLIAYSLGNNNCVYSKTDFNGNLVTTIPTALGGSLTAMKDGYLTDAAGISVAAGESANVTIKLFKKKMTNIIVKSLTFPPNATLGEQLPDPQPTPVPLADNEEVTLILTRIRDSPFEGSISPAGQYSNANPLELELVPGRYSVEANVMLNKRTIIPPQVRDDFVTPMVDLPAPHLWGGVKLDEFVVKPENLYQYQDLEFVVLSLPEPTVIENLQWLSDIQVKSQELNHTLLKPKFKNKII